MICTACSFENAPDAKFCQNCGSALSRACASCGTSNEGWAKFCKQCGARLDAPPPGSEPERRLAATPPDPRLARLVANTPAALAEKIRTASHLSGERRTVTALFADVVGSTALAAHMDPEDWTEVMNQAFDLLVPAVYRYEGTIARLMGDGLLAFFGAPVAHEDDPLRAAYAALEILSTMRQYAEKVRRLYGIDFAVRVGLSTGPVVVGDVGSDLVYEYTAMGDAINLASRMQAAARPMSVLIPENTHRFIAPVFETRDVGQIAIKGKTEPVQVYEVIGRKTRPGRLRGLSGLSSPMVGREAELKTLLDLYDVSRAGLGRAVLLVGEAGLGKSRLLAEWKNRLLEINPPGVGITWVEGRCLSYGQALAYHLLTDLLRSLLGLPEKSEEVESYIELQAICGELLGESAAEFTPFLGHLLSIPLDGVARDRVDRFDPQSLQNQYLSAIRRLIMELARRTPLVIVCEDIHWADPSSVDSLIKLLPLTRETRVLFSFLTRPDHAAPGWQMVNAARDTLGASLTEIHLRALSETASRMLVSNLLEIDALPENIRLVILDKAEGNPFFVEEVIRMLVEHGIIYQKDGNWAASAELDALEIPDNLHGLLLARIDRLPEAIKRTLKVAAVIGRQFSVNVLEKVLERHGAA